MYTLTIQPNIETKSHKTTNIKQNQNISFQGLKPEVLRNQMKIYLSQDIFAEKLSVRLPESDLEKEVLLEILKNRLKLERLTQLANEKMRLKTKLNEAVDLAEKNPESPKLEELRTELLGKGDLETVFSTLSENIEKEKDINKDAVQYFEEIKNLEAEYMPKFLSAGKIDKFFRQVRKQDINADKQYSVEELIEIINKQGIKSEEELTPKTRPLPQKAKITMSKSQFKEKLAKEYELYMRQQVNMYLGENMSVGVVKPIVRSLLLDKYAAYFKKYPETEQYMAKINASVRNKFQSYIERFGNVEIFNLQNILEEMNSVMATIKKTQKEITEIENKLLTDSENTSLKELLEQKKKFLKENKSDWTEYMIHTMEAEEKNREKITKAGFAKEYEWLVGENLMINRFKELQKIAKENNGVLPEETWKKLAL